MYLHAEGPEGGLGREFSFPGDRGSIRSRSVVGALHLVRRLLTQSADEAGMTRRLAWGPMSGCASSSPCACPSRRSTPSRRGSRSTSSVPRSSCRAARGPSHHGRVPRPPARRRAAGVLGSCGRPRFGPGGLRLAPARYRETRSVAMLVTRRPRRRRDGVRGRPPGAARADRRLPARRPALASARHGGPVPGAAAAPARAARDGKTFVPSDAAAYLSRLRPGGAQYEVSGIGRL